MRSALRNIEEEMLRLPKRSRAWLAKRLIVSLDGRADLDSEQIWRREAERRGAELTAGKVTSVPAEKVYKRARAALK
jgi:putative addiction module component (TIGR02574 family)